jgi:tRNA(Ile)-lysidine synthetase-like protein
MRDPAPVPHEVAINGEVESSQWGVRVTIGAEADLRWTCSVPDDEPLVLRSRRPGDRVRTRAGTRKVSDILIDAKIPRVLRDFVPIVATSDRALAVVGVTGGDQRDRTVLGAEPHEASWSRAVLWR